MKELIIALVTSLVTAVGTLGVQRLVNRSNKEVASYDRDGSIAQSYPELVEQTTELLKIVRHLNTQIADSQVELGEVKIKMKTIQGQNDRLVLQNHEFSITIQEQTKTIEQLKSAMGAFGKDEVK